MKTCVFKTDHRIETLFKSNSVCFTSISVAFLSGAFILPDEIILLFFKKALPVTSDKEESHCRSFNSCSFSSQLVFKVLLLHSGAEPLHWQAFFFFLVEVLCWNVCMFSSYFLAGIHCQLPLFMRYWEVIPGPIYHLYTFETILSG